MSENRFSIKYRIFKKERVRDSNQDLVIVPKTKNIENKNQIEFSWSNKGLKPEHLNIIGRVMIKEWERLLKDFPIYRGFIQVQDINNVRFYISFAVENNLTSDEIKKIISTALTILDECLEKVTKKVFGEEKYKELYPEIKAVKIIPKQNDDLVVTVEPDNVSMKKVSLPLESFEQKDSGQQPLVQQTQIAELTNQKNLLNKEVEMLKIQLEKSKSINRELDKVNLKLSSTIKEEKEAIPESEKVKLLEERAQELQKENSDYRVQCLESQSLIDQYNNKNEHLNNALEKMKEDQKELLEQAQDDYKNLDESLKESHKKLILETNERQKLEIHIEDVRKKLAEAMLENQDKTKEIKSLTIDLQNQEEFTEDKIEEIRILNGKLDEINSELDLSYATNDILTVKNDELEAQREKFEQIDEWQEKYEALEIKYAELEQEGYGYRQDVNLLKSQIKQFEEKLTDIHQFQIESTPVFEHNVVEEILDKKPESETENKKPVGVSNEKYEYEYEAEFEDFSYELDPYVEEVVSEELMNIRKVDQVDDEQRIQELLEAYEEDAFKDIKVSKEEYRHHILEFKFLSFRWSQVFIMEDADKNAAFLEWCSPYIEKIEDFEEELSLDVKKSFFMKNYVTMDESTFNILKGYSKLSSYLDTYYLKLSFYIDKYFLNEGNR